MNYFHCQKEESRSHPENWRKNGTEVKPRWLNLEFQISTAQSRSAKPQSFIYAVSALKTHELRKDSLAKNGVISGWVRCNDDILIVCVTKLLCHYENTR